MPLVLIFVNFISELRSVIAWFSDLIIRGQSSPFGRIRFVDVKCWNVRRSQQRRRKKEEKWDPNGIVDSSFFLRLSDSIHGKIQRTLIWWNGKPETISFHTKYKFSIRIKNRSENIRDLNRNIIQLFHIVSCSIRIKCNKVNVDLHSWRNENNNLSDWWIVVWAMSYDFISRITPTVNYYLLATQYQRKIDTKKPFVKHLTCSAFEWWIWMVQCCFFALRFQFKGHLFVNWT